MKKDPLGKGLSAILKDIEEKATIRLIPLTEISPNPKQPRFEMKEETLMELASSIKEKGVLQPVILKRKEDGYEIIAGERRYRASIIAGLTEIPAIIKDVDEREAMEIALIENLQREDLNPIEIATVYEHFIVDFGYTQEEFAKRIGIDRSSVSNLIRLLKLPDWVKKHIAEGRLTQGHARVLLTLKDEEEQRRFVERVINEGVSVRELERAAKKGSIQRDSAFLNIEEALSNALQTRVQITYKRNKGRIIIEFYSKDDLERIVESIERGHYDNPLIVDKR